MTVWMSDRRHRPLLVWLNNCISIFTERADFRRSYTVCPAVENKRSHRFDDGEINRRFNYLDCEASMSSLDAASMRLAIERSSEINWGSFLKLVFRWFTLVLKQDSTASLFYFQYRKQHFQKKDLSIKSVLGSGVFFVLWHFAATSLNSVCASSNDVFSNFCCTV